MLINSLDEVKFLYKYRSFDTKNYNIKTIIDNEFYFASRNELNDPFDLSRLTGYEFATEKELIKNANEILERNIHNMDENDHSNYENRRFQITDDKSEYIKSYIATFEEKIKEVGICSFTANKWNDILMWSHYCQNHTGFCLGLNWKSLSRHLLEIQKNVKIVPFQVIYGEQYKLINPFNDVENEAYRNSLCYKYKVWEYENEIRLIILKGASTTHSLPENIIEEVTLGLYINDTDKQLITNALKLKQSKIKLYQIFQMDRSFEFDRKEIIY